MSRRDAGDARETPEKVIAGTPERRIGTYDDLGTGNGDKGIETYDDLRRSGNERSINTYDDLRAPADGGDKNTVKVADGHRHDTLELAEQRRIDNAAEGIRGLERMKPGNWKNLRSIDDKRLALQSAGRELGRAYNSPEPPLETKNLGEPGTQGEYGDGYSYDARTDEVVGSDYGVRMNEDGFDPEKNKKLFGSDPRQAIETYGHEFRHSYQFEQVHAFEKGLKVDDPDKAREWSENLKPGNYTQPPDSIVTEADWKQYEAYRNQPVGRDAREFGSKLADKIYGDNGDIEGYKKWT